MMPKSTALIVLAIIVALLVIYFVPVNTNQDDELQKKRTFCAGEIRRAVGLGLEIEVKRKDIADLEADIFSEISQAGLSALLAIENLSQKNKEKLIDIFGLCMNGDMEKLKSENDRLMQELEIQKRDLDKQKIGNAVRGLDGKIQTIQKVAESYLRQGREFESTLINQFLDVSGELESLLDEFKDAEFEGVHAQKIWINKEIGILNWTLAIAKRDRKEDFDAYVSKAEIHFDNVFKIYEKSQRLFNKYNAKWLRDYFIIEETVLHRALLNAELKNSNNFQTDLAELHCDYLRADYVKLIDNPFFVKHGGSEYAQNICGIS